MLTIKTTDQIKDEISLVWKMYQEAVMSGDVRSAYRMHNAYKALVAQLNAVPRCSVCCAAIELPSQGELCRFCADTL